MKQLYQDYEMITLFENAYHGVDKELIHAAAKDVADAMAEKARILLGPAWSLSIPGPIRDAMEEKRYSLADLLAHPEKEIAQWQGVNAQSIARYGDYLASNGLGRLLPHPPNAEKFEVYERIEVVLLDTLATKLCLLTRHGFSRAFESKGVAYMVAMGSIKAIWDKTGIFYGDPRKLGIPNTLAAFMRDQSINNFRELFDRNELLHIVLGLPPEDMQAAYAIMEGYKLMDFV